MKAYEKEGRDIFISPELLLKIVENRNTVEN